MLSGGLETPSPKLGSNSILTQLLILTTLLYYITPRIDNHKTYTIYKDTSKTF